MFSCKTLFLAIPSILAVFGAAQFFRPALNEPPQQSLLAGSQLPSEMSHLFQRACQDCHSNNTRWPWYARTAPISWMVTRDVARGRAFMNLSEWERYGKKQQMGYLASMASAAVDRKMPPKLYSMMHEDARLTDLERQKISKWARAEYIRLRRSN